ncbi:hypothetical protein NW762_012082 [Fusarium torreyae]|uniref:Uncharacterized protein n=1 Tax=Fusarium torreyae TaxID=1237075 RepID=A0A9W8RPN0_9HYPO|nr:hypothetical protein NW762_012082 [Fusarium torreyae]
MQFLTIALGFIATATLGSAIDIGTCNQQMNRWCYYNGKGSMCPDNARCLSGCIVDTASGLATSCY